MDSRRWQDDLRVKINGKLGEIEEQVLRDSNNQAANDDSRMPTNYFTAFMLIGGDERMLTRLHSLVEGLVENADAYAFFCWEENIGKRVHDELRLASEKYVNVTNLDTILLCPIYFASEGTDVSLLEGAKAVRESVPSNVVQLWQPYLVINWDTHRYVEAYKGITRIKELMDAIPRERMHRCCLLSDRDENNFAVESENILETIALCTVLQNTKPENGEVTGEISRKVCCEVTDAESGKIFFTAKSASVCNPVRTVTLQRMISAFKYMCGDTDKTGNANVSEQKSVLERMRFDFLAQALEPYMAELPYNKEGEVSFFPLYGVMGQNDGDLQECLRKQINEYYVTPLSGDGKLAENVRSGFFKALFDAKGSLDELRKIIQDIGTKGDKVLSEKVGAPGGVKFEEAPRSQRAKSVLSSGRYAKAREGCKSYVENAGKMHLKNLAEELKKSETMEMIRYVQEQMDIVVQCIENRLNGLGKIEIALPLGQTMNQRDFAQVQDGWFEMQVQNGERKNDIERKRSEFSAETRRMIQTGKGHAEKLLTCCYEAVRGEMQSNRAFIDALGVECASNEQKATAHASCVAAGWSYPLHFINRDSSSDITCLVGDAENSLCTVLNRRFNAKLFQFSKLDKLGVLHVSSAFGVTEIMTWNDIEKLGMEAMKCAIAED